MYRHFKVLALFTLRWGSFIMSIMGASFLSLAICFFVLFPKGTHFSQDFQASATGYICAFVCIFVAYFSAPAKSSLVSWWVFLIGSIAAFVLLKDIEYANDTHFLAVGESTLIPVLFTNAGGLTALFLTLPLQKRSKKNLASTVENVVS